jgi:hypothetical protein
MKTFSSVVSLFLLGTISAKTERSSVFSLKEDDMIIRTPQNLDDLHQAGASHAIGDH